jgi:hypothetical protein
MRLKLRLGPLRRREPAACPDIQPGGLAVRDEGSLPCLFSIRVLALRSRPVVSPCGWAFSCLMTAWISWPPRPGRIRCRPPRITWAVIFQVVGMPVQDVSTADVLAFITAQRVECRPGLAGSYGSGRGRVDADGCSPALDHLGLFAYLHVHGDVATRSVPRGLATRHQRQRPRQGVPLVRSARTLPRILGPTEVDAGRARC